jgi:exosortase/archaeosortase family protein
MNARKKAKVPAQAARGNAGGFLVRWRRALKTVLGFVLRFAAFTLAWFTVSFLPFWGHLVALYLEATAWLASSILNLLGQHSHVTGTSISSARFAIAVLQSCAASEMMAFFCAALLAFPASWGRKIVGLLAGTMGIALLNVVRISTVFLVGIYQPKYFQTLHEEVWPGLLVIAALMLALGWMRWVTQLDAAGRPSASPRSPFLAVRFVLVFGLLLLPWPGLTERSGDALRSLGMAAYGGSQSAREITFEPLGSHMTRIVIVNQRLMNADGSGPVRNLDFNTSAFFWQPFCLFFALTMATAMLTRDRLLALGLGGGGLLGYLLLALSFAIWNESTEVSLVTLAPFWKGVANEAEAALVRQLSMAAPVIVWLLSAIPRPSSWMPSETRRSPHSGS